MASESNWALTPAKISDSLPSTSHLSWAAEPRVLQFLYQPLKKAFTVPASSEHVFVSATKYWKQPPSLSDGSVLLYS
jgi:hypothetical protein